MFGINEDTAKQLVEKFFEQQHSNILVEKTVLKGTMWIVTVSTGTSQVVRRVRIDTITGKILGFE
ncbi:MAG TPA: hypothetical protein VGR54_09675 [Nitrosopumilaceae archaeon]|nr:hypothetical protein [Nitrosopumilaceae archaeon]